MKASQVGEVISSRVVTGGTFLHATPHTTFVWDPVCPLQFELPASEYEPKQIVLSPDRPDIALRIIFKGLP